MIATGISLILPLADALRHPRTGGKATNLSRLIAARFAVPRGFVISADAYRSHLWASGARAAAASAVEAEDREQIRSAILLGGMPEDISSAAAQAYERLSWQIGGSDPKVAVRSSALEPSAADSGFPGAYESYLNVAGLESLQIAVKRVWASTWNGKAAGYRARLGATSEPAMAVIVQQMIEAKASGSAMTANPVTGDPQKVLVSCNGPDPDAPPVCYNVDLRHRPEASSDEEIIALAAEKAILIEDVLGSPVEIEWAWDGERLWVLQARLMTDQPPCFPTDWAEQGDSGTEWRRLTDRPISVFARSLLCKTTPAALGPGKRDTDNVRVSNGYVYMLATSTGPRQKDEISTATALLARWEEQAKPKLRAEIEAALEVDLPNSDHPSLLRLLAGTAEASRTAAQWIEAARGPSTAIPDMLRELLATKAADPAMFDRLVEGIPTPALMRDARLQELGERLAIAEDSGKLNDGAWWRGYKADVEQFAREYGFSFTDSAELWDVSAWTSWVEDTEAVFRIAGALARRDNRPTLVTLSCAAEAAAQEAAREARELLNGKDQKRFEDILRLTRSWLAMPDEARQVHALACTATRLVLAELAGRLCGLGLLAQHDDIFCFELGELLSMEVKPTPDRAPLAASIARRKHQFWLEQRFSAPPRLPIGSEERHEDAADGVINGNGIVPGQAAGRVRIARTLAEAGELQCGEILIVRDACAAWTPFLTIAGGMAAEGDYCPAFVRDYGVPVIVGCKALIATVSDGHRIRLDGATGTVELPVKRAQQDPETALVDH